MTITALEGPVITFNDGVLPGQEQNANPEQGPSLFVEGVGLLDPRLPFTYYPGQPFGSKTYGFLSNRFVVIDQIPSALAANNIAASQTPGSGHAINLVTASGAGITVGAAVKNATTGQMVGGLLAIDGAMGSVPFGQSGTVQIWNPQTAISRNVRVTSGGDDSGISFTVNGYDIYGYPMSETIAGADAGAASGKKAFKYIASIAINGTAAGTVEVGTGDVYGYPIRVDELAYTESNWSGAINTGTFVAADTTNPATAMTGDVRGTYAVPSASNGTNRLVAFVTVPVANVGTVAGIFGVSQA